MVGWGDVDMAGLDRLAVRRVPRRHPADLIEQRRQFAFVRAYMKDDEQRRIHLARQRRHKLSKRFDAPGRRPDHHDRWLFLHGRVNMDAV